MDYLSQIMQQVFGPHQLDQLQPNYMNDHQQRMIDYIRSRFMGRPLDTKIGSPITSMLNGIIPTSTNGSTNPPSSGSNGAGAGSGASSPSGGSIGPANLGGSFPAGKPIQDVVNDIDNGGEIPPWLLAV